MEKLSEFAQKVEKKAPLKLTEEEKKIVAAIEEQRDGKCMHARASEGDRKRCESERSKVCA